MKDKTTPFSVIYERFLSKITDDMYMELTELETFALLQELLLSALPYFEFPRKDLRQYELSYEEYGGVYNGVESDGEDATVTIYDGGVFNIHLNDEEINIIATYMVVAWIGQQLASVENVRMKYSGSDFKFTSQANHLSKLVTLKREYITEGFHLQRLYKRHAPGPDGRMRSTFDMIMEPLPPRGF